VKCHCADEPSTSRTLLSGRLLELDYQLSGHPSAVFDVDALCLGPLADLGRVQPVRRCFASVASWPPGAAPGSAGGSHVACQCVPQLLGMGGVQVDLIVGAVQSEADGTVGLAAIEVVDEEGLDLLGPWRLRFSGWFDASAYTIHAS
jgi:hypothetical protein